MRAARTTAVILMILASTFLPFAAFGGGRRESGDTKTEGPRVVVSIPPEAYLVDRVSGGRVSVTVLVPAGADPHTYEPTPRQMAELSRARLYFRIGVDFESSLVPKIREAVPNLQIVDLRAGIRLRRLEGDAGGEGGGGEDPHCWMSPLNARIMTRTIVEALSEADPAGATIYQENGEALTQELSMVHEHISAALAPLRGRCLLVRHPAFGYFADLYGLRQVAVERLGAEPSAADLARLVDRARRCSARVIFVQPEFSRESAMALAREIGAAVVPIDPLAYDYVENLRRIAGAVREALQQRASKTTKGSP